MKYSEIMAKPLKEDATAGATCAGNVATVVGTFMAPAPEPKKPKKKKVAVVRR